MVHWNRQCREVTPQGEVAYSYDAGGRRLSMTLKNGAPGSQTTLPTISYTWDNAGDDPVAGDRADEITCNGTCCDLLVLCGFGIWTCGRLRLTRANRQCGAILQQSSRIDSVRRSADPHEDASLGHAQ